MTLIRDAIFAAKRDAKRNTHDSQIEAHSHTPIQRTFDANLECVATTDTINTTKRLCEPSVAALPSSTGCDGLTAGNRKVSLSTFPPETQHASPSLAMILFNDTSLDISDYFSVIFVLFYRNTFEK